MESRNAAQAGKTTSAPSASRRPENMPQTGFPPPRLPDSLAGIKTFPKI
jgi:hypothetical protein